MNKLIYYVSVGLFGSLGAFIPSLFGANGFSGWAIVGSTVGGFFGVYAAYKLIQNM